MHGIGSEVAAHKLKRFRPHATRGLERVGERARQAIHVPSGHDAHIVAE